ncbi:hypothetical protein GA830_10545 [Mesorhizobium sp. NBSH29]|uniref:hypothetical protein n=1 Tax=Mesorhizobium sp. NBSH29 TaxID=2654249 RepID=UPI0018965DFD|nr:hypothetical protein [Mesorhizobium sp. NBSH29]QPC87133.1 hypothetical protein GA830_10545 [Mesorhizobium sp. NBSH29]
MRVVIRKQNIKLILSFQERAKLLGNKHWQTEAFRGVVDAGRKTKTQVQRSVHNQMAMKKYGFTAQNTRGTPRRAELAFEIYALKGGQRVEEYKGLRALSPGGSAAGKMNTGRSNSDAGFVKSSVWNSPRTFKRSFATNGGYFAMLPGGTSTKAPKMLWTFGAKKSQPRGAGGRFGKSSQRYGKIRRLFGPALRKELVKDQALSTFYRVGPKLLEDKVMKRMEKLIKF